jgi:hypothetical protein
VQIFTNNPDAVRYYNEAGAIAVKRIDGGAGEMFAAVRDAVHGGARVLTHPLSGVAPWECFYKSIAVCVVAAARPVHFPSLALIEEAMAKLKAAPSVDLTETPDFRTMDLEIIKSFHDNKQGAIICPNCTTF